MTSFVKKSAPIVAYGNSGPREHRLYLVLIAELLVHILVHERCLADTKQLKTQSGAIIPTVAEDNDLQENLLARRHG